MEVSAGMDVTVTDTAGEIVFSLMCLRKQRNVEALGHWEALGSDRC